MRIYSLAALLIAVVAFVAFRNKKQPDPPPNIVIIFMDDMGYGDPSCYNGKQYQTPFIDQMAAGGMRFTDFYAAQAVCTASRAGLLTGCYPNRIGITGAFMPWSKIALNPNETTIAKMLQQEGYRTAMVGKWHLGAKAPNLPIHYGFDEYLGLPYSNDMWPYNYDGKPATDTNLYQNRYPPLQLLEGDKPIKEINTFEDQGQLTQTYTKRACEFIRNNKKKPFFLYLAHSMTHVPIAVSPAFRGKSKEGLFGDMMQEVDWSVGEVMKTLKEAGIDKNTLVIFTSDNGPWLNFGNHAGNTGGLREGKGTTFEGGMRVPCIMRWPSKIPAGVVCNKLSATIDLLPTIAGITHAKLPENKIDGVDILPLLLNQKDANPRDELAYYYRANNLEAVRKGQWKLMLSHPSQTYKQPIPGKDGFPAKTSHVEVPLALYNLRTDPGETVDLQTQYPEVVKELQLLANKYRSDLGDDLTKVACTNCRAAAKVQ